jgi:hypothetical protein
MPRTDNPKGRTTACAAFSFPLGLHQQVKDAAAAAGMNPSQFVVLAVKAQLAKARRAGHQAKSGSAE